MVGHLECENESRQGRRTRRAGTSRLIHERDGVYCIRST
jgi:hypothetical protein